MVVTTTSGGAHPAIEQTVPILELLIPEYITVQEKNSSTMDVRDIDHSDILGTHGRHDHMRGRKPSNRADGADFGAPDP